MRNLTDDEFRKMIESWGFKVAKENHIEKLKNQFMNCHSFIEVEIVRHLNRDFLKSNPECYEMIFHARKRINRELRNQKSLNYQMN